MDEPCPVKGFVSVVHSSLAWKDKVGMYEVKLTQGPTVSLYEQHSLTIPIGSQVLVSRLICLFDYQNHAF